VPKKKTVVKYTSRDFNSIKSDLVEYAKRYYPETFRDFSEASFGSLMLDTVAYVGDMLSFYLDYQANESFLSTAIEYDNVIKLSQQMGYRLSLNPSAFGIASFYLIVPANAAGEGPNTAYLPMLERGSEFSTVDGRGFILNEDINFAASEHQSVAARQDPTTGTATFFAVKAFGQIISGELSVERIKIGSFEKFKRITIPGENIAEILSVVDAEGNEYSEVSYLAQDVIYKPLKNRNSATDGVQAVLTAVPVPRRFVVEQLRNKIYLQFGFGSESELTTKSVADPSQVVLKVYGKDYFSDRTLDPNKLIETDTFGVGPANTTLTITYRVNTAGNMNAAAASLTGVGSTKLRFTDITALSTAKVADVINSLEVNNEQPIMGSITYPTSEEIRRRTYATFATQNRAVTRQDYISMVYNMPPEFGAVKRCNIVQDEDSFKRNLNLYVVSENNARALTETNAVIKQNLKRWLTSVKMINDTIDILNGRIVNLGIEFVAIGDYETNQYDILQNVYDALVEHFEILPNMSQPFYVSDIYNVINDTPGIVDVQTVDITRKIGANYSGVSFNIEEYTTADGRVINFPEDFIWEIKYPKLDIKGTLK